MLSHAGMLQREEEGFFSRDPAAAQNTPWSTPDLHLSLLESQVIEAPGREAQPYATQYGRFHSSQQRKSSHVRHCHLPLMTM